MQYSFRSISLFWKASSCLFLQSWRHKILINLRELWAKYSRIEHFKHKTCKVSARLPCSLAIFYAITKIFWNKKCMPKVYMKSRDSQYKNSKSALSWEGGTPPPPARIDNSLPRSHPHSSGRIYATDWCKQLSVDCFAVSEKFYITSVDPGG